MEGGGFADLPSPPHVFTILFGNKEGSVH